MEGTDDQPPRPCHAGLKVIGALKLISGATALLVGIGVFRFLDHDPGPRAERIVTHLGLDPHNHIIHEVISRITGIDRTHLRALEVGTFFYAALHTVEGIGLILGYHWAEYLSSSPPARSSPSRSTRSPASSPSSGSPSSS